MDNPPININTAPAQTTAINPSGKPSAKDNAAPRDTQNFSSMLSRQVASTAKKPESSPTESKRSSSAEAAKQNDGLDSAQTPSMVDTSSLPADILAALMGLAIQTPAASTEAATLISNITVDVPLELTKAPLELTKAPLELTKAPLELTKAPLELIKGKDTANSYMPKIGAEIASAENAAKDSEELTDILLTSALKEASLSANSQPLPASILNESTAAPQLFGMAPVLSGATTPASNMSINAAINQPAWADEFGQKITWMATQRNQSAELHLNPPQLGPVDVVLKMNGDQATAMFTSPHAAVRDAIEQALPKLREMLAENGIMLGQAMVGDHSAKNGQDSTARKSSGQSASSLDVAEGAAIQEIHVAAISRHNGMVDTFA